MRLPCVRFTVRWMMAFVAFLGIGTWLVNTAVQATRGPHTLYHYGLRADTGEMFSVEHEEEGTFWPRYRRALLGQPWPGSYQCPCKEEIEQKFRTRLLLMGSSISDKGAMASSDRGNIAAMKGDYDRALADFDLAVQLEPTFTEAYKGRGIAWHSKQDFDKAIADYTELIRLDPTCAMAHMGRGAAWESKRDFDQAIADYTAAIRLDPDDDWTHNHCAWLWATCPEARYRDGTQAVTSATRACELSGWKEAFYLGTLAAASAEAGDFDAAVKWQDRAVERYEEEKDRESGRARLALYREKKPYREPPVVR